MGGGRKSGKENLRKHTPSKRGLWTPIRVVRFLPGRVMALFFLHDSSQPSRPEVILEGPVNFREGVLSGTFPSAPRFSPNAIQKPNVQFHTASHSIPQLTHSLINGKRKKPINIKEFGGTPPLSLLDGPQRSSPSQISAPTVREEKGTQTETFWSGYFTVA